MSVDSQAESDLEIGHVGEATQESLLSKLRLLLWPQHEPFIAGLLLMCLIGMSAFFVYRSMGNGGLVEIDQAGSLSAEFLVDINKAEIGEIVLLPGVGEKLALAIVEYREDWGDYQSFEALKEVDGIGEKKLENLKPYLLPIPVRPAMTLPKR